MQRLGRNKGGYHGETIDIAAVLRDIKHAAAGAGWQHEKFAEEPELISLRRVAQNAPRRLYISTGIHGDEPAGPLAVRELLRENRWPGGLEIWLCPCLNPTGFPLNRRENWHGQDLNRQYLHLEATETRAHVDWLKNTPTFDVTLCLHEDWESNGFYLYELNPDARPTHADEIIRRVAEVCPIDLAPEIEGRPAGGGIIRPGLDPLSRPQWPEAFWLLRHKTRHSYTMESPSDFPLDVRVRALMNAVDVVAGTLGTTPG